MFYHKKRYFFLLWILCILGSLSVLPYSMSIGLIPSSPQIFLLATVQAVVFFGLICWLSSLLIPKTDLSPFSTESPLKRIVYPGVIAGLVVGFIIYILDITLFRNSLLAGSGSPAWAGLLASFYGAINEEVLLRLFLFTFIYFLFGKISRTTLHNRSVFLWMTNIIVALLFGLGHLPAAFKLITPSKFEIFRILLLNGIPGLLFGWLYWFRSLWAAMLAHFVADLVIHVFV